ncbi:hypothetical protein RD1_1857 [Roseobacter denitrificans OCh 114]|uniref:DUF1826 domain-containing protein n=1 Tax=Roseobacter denitrificans (strain ATCC 33942 / OCh 114) TaxID=375451 RepID=Q168X5_ROSDO|nr:hypothetical protein RD1_1857 [Roseobacter denitrificans OCh 114]
MGVAVADRPEDLVAIRKPGCAAAIWRRQAAPAFQSWLDALPSTQLPRLRATLRPEDVSDALSQLFDRARTPKCAERVQLIDDMAALAHLFADLMQARYLQVRLEPVKTNACRKFHVDAVMARLICTYRGTGTQYGISKKGDDPLRVFTVPTGSPILLRGTLWPDSPRSGLLHRSPPIEGSEETRLVLVLDPVFDREDAL